MVSSNQLHKVYQSGDRYLIEDTMDIDEEKWFREITWDQTTNKANLIDKGYWSISSLNPPPKKVPKAFYSPKKKKVILANILD